jgi:hypothetical protein
MLSLAGACGGSQQGTGGTTPDTPDAPAVQALDIAHELAEETLEGLRFTPEALERPGMPSVEQKRMPTLAAQKKKVAGQKKKDHDSVHVLVTLLWAEADSHDQAAAAALAKQDQATADAELAAATALRDEARGLLRELHGAAAGSATEITTYRLAIAEITQGDEAAATTALQDLTSRFAQSANAVEHATWLAYLHLRVDRTADAAALVEGWDATAEATTASAAYVVAWVKFRQRDTAAAQAAIAAAAKKWRGGVGRPALERDTMLILARTGATAEQADAVLGVGGLSAQSAHKRATLLFTLAREGYLYAGHYDLAAATLDLMIGTAVPSDVVTFRFMQSDFEYRQHRPLVAAQRAAEAWGALGKCDQCPAQIRDLVAQRIADLAVRFHTIYVSSLDESFGRAAKVLYDLYGSIPDRADTEEMRGHQSSLNDAMTSADPQNGKHDKSSMSGVLLARREALSACYEAVLATETTLAGSLKLTVEVNPTGQVVAVASEPAAGATGMAAVADCAAARIKAFTFPARTVPGRTVLVYPVVFKPKSPLP